MGRLEEKTRNAPNTGGQERRREQQRIFPSAIGEFTVLKVGGTGGGMTLVKLL